MPCLVYCLTSFSMSTSGCGCAEEGTGTPWKKRAAAWVLSRTSKAGDEKLQGRKEELFKGLTRERGVHTVLELGIGSGPNLKYYASSVDRVIGVDYNPATDQYAESTAAAAGLPPGKLRLLTGSAEQLLLEDNSVDAVVATHILCTVESPQRALAEALRVLKPGGRYIFIEHVAAAPGSRLARVQSCVQPVLRLLADCHVDRATLATIRAAGFSGVQADEFWLEVPSLCAFWGPHISGVAVK